MWRTWTIRSWSSAYGEVSAPASMMSYPLHQFDSGYLCPFWLFPGDVVLENLILKQNALEELNIPVQTVYGHLGKFFLSWFYKKLLNTN